MNRRSFFQSIARAAAIVALAPQIAFRAPKLKLVVEPPQQVAFWRQITRRSRCVDSEYLKVYSTLFAASINPLTKDQLDEVFK